MNQKQSSKTKICGDIEVQSFVSMFSKAFISGKKIIVLIL